jgi:hypothetical protein
MNEAMIALIGRLLYNRFKVYQRLKAVFKKPGDTKVIDACILEILKLLPLGHNLPFLILSLIAVSSLRNTR